MLEGGLDAWTKAGLPTEPRDPLPPGVTDIRISIEELQTRIDAGEDFFFIDTRTSGQLASATDMIPDALNVVSGEVDKHAAEIPHDRPIATYCT